MHRVTHPIALIALAAGLAGCGGGDDAPMYERGENIVYRPTQLQMSRCGAEPHGRFPGTIIAVPGDAVEIRDDGYIYVNGESSGHRNPASPPDPPTVPDGSYFVAGTLGDRSCDSTIWGYLPEDHVVSGELDERS